MSSDYPRTQHLKQLLQQYNLEYTNSKNDLESHLANLKKQIEELESQRKWTEKQHAEKEAIHVQKVQQAFHYCKQDPQFLTQLPAMDRIPTRFAKHLFPYQKSCIDHMLNVAHFLSDSIKILGNAPGTGKTRMVLVFAFIALRSNLQVSKRKILIIIPSKLMQHWKLESASLGLVTGKEVLFYGNVYSLRRESVDGRIQNQDPDQIPIPPIEIIGHNCFIKYSKECAKYLNDELYTLIFDENETRESSDFFWHKSKCDHWIVSGTYKDNKAWNHLQEKLGHDAVVHASASFIQQSYTLPLMTSHVIRCKGLDPQIRQFLPQHTLALLNQGDMEGALRSVCSENETEFSEQSVILAHTQSLLQIEKECDEKLKDENESKDSILMWQKKKQDNENTRQNIIERIQDTLCPICYTDNMNAPVIITKCCVRRICLACLMRALSVSHQKSKCPWCRCAMLTADAFSVIKVAKSIGHIEDYRNGSKADALLALIQQELNESWLIVTENEHCFKLQGLLKSRGMSCDTLQGSADQVQDLIDRHSSRKVKVLFLNRLGLGVGVHLAHVTRILFYHVFATNSDYKQAIARAQRIGRTEPLIIYHLVTNNEEVDKSILLQHNSVT